MRQVRHHLFHDLFEIKYRHDDLVRGVGCVTCVLRWVRDRRAAQLCLVREEACDMRDRDRRRVSCVCLACVGC